MDFRFAPELHFQPIQTSTDDGFAQPPPQFVDDFGITAENVDLYAAELDLELLREFFGSSLGEDIAKEARADDSESQSEASPPAPSSSNSTASSSSPASSSSSTVSSAENGRKRKAAQDRFCVNCKTPKSSMWRRDPESGDTLCNACGQHLKKFKVHRPATMFDRPIKKRCRKFKEEALAAPRIQISTNCHSFGPAPHFQQPQQQLPPPYIYQQYQQQQPIQPHFTIQPFHQPPPNAYYPYNNWQSHPSYPLPPYFQQGQ